MKCDKENRPALNLKTPMSESKFSKKGTPPNSLRLSVKKSSDNFQCTPVSKGASFSVKKKRKTKSPNKSPSKEVFVDQKTNEIIDPEDSFKSFRRETPAEGERKRSVKSAITLQ